MEVFKIKEEVLDLTEDSDEEEMNIIKSERISIPPNATEVPFTSDEPEDQKITSQVYPSGNCHLFYSSFIVIYLYEVAV